MKIALVHDFLFTYGGAERVLQCFHGLYPDAPIYTLLADDDIVRRHFPKATIITSSLNRSRLKKKPQFLLSRMPRAIEEFDLNGFDVVLSSSGAFSHNVITGPETKHVSYCHSPVRYAWDYHHQYLKERKLDWFPMNRIMQKILGDIRLWDYVGARRVDKFYANSGAVADRIRKFYRMPAEVIYPPVNVEYFDYEKAAAPSIGPGGVYAISACRLSPNKRVDLMIRACAQLNLHLVVIGNGSARKDLEDLAHSLNAPVSFVGGVSEEEKRDLIAQAHCFLFAAEDDFGIAPVEALSLGVPVISLAKGGIQEVIKAGNSGYFFPEPTVDDLSAAVMKLLEKGVAWDKKKIRASVLGYGQDAFEANIKKAVSDAYGR